MRFIDARTLEDGCEIATDICILGAGAAGITLAAELDGSAQDVCLIESGGLGPDEKTQALCDLESLGYPIRENFMSRARYYGGSCNLWAGRSMKLMEIDFERREWVPHSGWPISYSELLPYHARAARVLSLPAFDRYDARIYTDGMTSDERRLFDSSDIHPTVSLWAKRPMRFGRVYRRRLQRSRNIRVYLHANATRINLNGSGRAAESVDVRGLNGRQLVVKARVIVLACGGLENARLLLVSRDAHPSGVGNDHGNVGRFYMDHPRAVFGEVRLRKGIRLPLLRGVPLRDGKAQFGIGLTEAVQRRDGLLNHYLTFEEKASQYAEKKYETTIRFMKVLLRKGYAGRRWDFRSGNLPAIPDFYYLLSPKELMPHLLYRWYVGAKRKLKPDMGDKSYVLVNFCEQPPDPQSRVYLSEDKDHLGMNKLVLDWRIGDGVKRSLARLHDLTRGWLEATEIGTIETPQAEVHYTDASHHMGTTRMSVSPRDGVVDCDCQVHGVANLFVAGSSVFPTAGHANPTAALVALAIRLADRLGQGVGRHNG